MYKIIVGKERFLFKSFIGLAEEQLFLRGALLSIALVSLSLSQLFLIPSQEAQSLIFFFFKI